MSRHRVTLWRVSASVVVLLLHNIQHLLHQLHCLSTNTNANTFRPRFSLVLLVVTTACRPRHFEVQQSVSLLAAVIARDHFW